MTVPAVHLRFFASARAAMGVDDLEVPVADAASIEEALTAVAARDSADPDVLLDVLSRCSFLLNGVATTDRSAPLGVGDELDVLPPFAGG